MKGLLLLCFSGTSSTNGHSFRLKNGMIGAFFPSLFYERFSPFFTCEFSFVLFHEPFLLFITLMVFISSFCAFSRFLLGHLLCRQQHFCFYAFPCFFYREKTDIPSCSILFFSVLPSYCPNVFILHAILLRYFFSFVTSNWKTEVFSKEKVSQWFSTSTPDSFPTATLGSPQQRKCFTVIQYRYSRFTSNCDTLGSLQQRQCFTLIQY